MANNTLFYYMNRIKVELFLPKKDPIEPIMIKQIKKRFNYHTNYYPIYDVYCSLDQKYLEEIRNSQYSIYCVLTIESLKFKAGDKDDKQIDSELTEYETNEVLKHTFIPFFPKDSFSSIIRNKDTDAAENGSEDDNGLTNNPAGALDKEIVMTLYSVKGLAANKSILNAVADECDVGTMIKYLISETDIEEAIIDTPDNTDTYKDLVVSPKNINLAIKELQLRYGIYDSGLTVFYDPPCLYVLNKLSNDHDCSKDKINNILLNISVGNFYGAMSPSLIKENDKNSIEYTFGATIFKDNKDVYNSELYGTEILFSNYTLSNVVATYKEGEVADLVNPFVSILTPNVKHKDTGEKIVVEYDELNNPYNMASYAKLMSQHTIIKLSTIRGVNIESFLPNSLLTIKVVDDDKMDQEFSDVYSIISGEMVFVRNGTTDDRFICSIENLELTNLTK